MSKISLLIYSVIALSSMTCPAAVVLSGDFDAGTGQLDITEDLSFTLTSAGAPRRVILDEYLIFDGSTQGPSSATAVTYAINGVDQINPINLQLFDGGISINDITPNDLQISFFGTVPPPMNIGDVFTIRSISVSGFAAAPGFNSGSGFAESIFLTQNDGTRLSANQNFAPETTGAVPEPSTMTLLGLGTLTLLLKRRLANRLK